MKNSAKKFLCLIVIVASLLTGCSGKDGKDGIDGVDGKDGKTPTISINEQGYWVINGVATSVLAKAENGKDGVDGKDGAAGKDGADGKDGAAGKDGADGKDGAAGKDGVDGKDGSDGKTPTISINEEGYWVINGVVTNVKAGEELSFWDGTASTTWYSSNEDKFVLDTAEDLAGLAQLVASGTDFSGKTIVLNSNIDLNNIEWTPIGNVSRKSETGHFTGTFDGNGNTIFGLNVTVNEDDQVAGLFATVNSATIKNLTVKGTANNSVDTAAGLVGAVVGTGTTVIENCHADVTVYGESTAAGLVGRAYGGTITVKDSTVRGTITGASKVAGIVAINSGSVITIDNCTNLASVSGGSGGTSGILAYANDNVVIINSTNYGKIGGAYDSSTNANKFASGILSYQAGTTNVSISTSINHGSIAGQFAGGIYAAKGSSNIITINNCTNKGAVTGVKYAGGIAAVAYGDIINSKNTAVVTATGTGTDDATDGVAGGILGGTDLNGSNSTNITNCSGGTASITASKYAGRLAGMVQNSTLSVDNTNGDDYSIPAVKAIYSGTTELAKAQILTVASGTLNGTVVNANKASLNKIIINEGASWIEFPGETGTWVLDGTWLSTQNGTDHWIKQ